MKNHTICWLLVFAPFLCFSQGTKTLQSGNTSTKQQAESDVLPISGLSGKNKLTLGFTAIDTSLYLTISGAGWGTKTIDKDDALMLLFSNDSVVTLKSTALQSIVPDPLQNTYRHRYAISSSDLAALSNFNLTGIRKYSFGDFSDLDIPLENAGKLKRLSASFLTALRKPAIGQSSQQITVKDIRNFIGDSVSLCSKVVRIKNPGEMTEGAMLLELQASFSEPAVTVMIPAEALRMFNGNPEKKYLNKDVCISGVPVLQNNVPYLTVRNSRQISVNSQVALSELAHFVGDSITVTGRVFSARYLEEAPTKPTIFYVRAPFQPEQGLTLLIKEEDRRNFDKPEQTYLHKKVRISGKVVLDQRQYQIILQNKGQIEILPDENPLPSYSAIKDEEETKTVFTSSHLAKDKDEEKVPGQTAAEFPGGNAAFNNYIQRNLFNPATQKENEKRRVVVSFEIDAWGMCQNIRVLESAGEFYDKEVKRVLQEMPKWKPAMRNGLRFPTERTQTVTFEHKSF